MLQEKNFDAVAPGNTYRADDGSIVKIVDKDYNNYRIFVGNDGNNYSVGGFSNTIELVECLTTEE